MERAFAAVVNLKAHALIVQTPNPVAVTNQDRIVNFAARSRLPSMFGVALFADSGGLMSYGSNGSERWRRAAIYVDKILKGARPADLPVEQPTRFELVVNMKTAKAIGLTIPQTILVRAESDRVATRRALGVAWRDSSRAAVRQG